MSSRAKCPRCGEDVRVYETVVTLDSESKQKAYDEADNRVEEIVDEIRERVADGEDRDEVNYDMEDELDEARQERSELAKGATKRALFSCYNCGFARVPAQDQPWIGVQISVDEEGIDACTILDHDLSDIADTIRYFTDAAYREAQHEPDEELRTPLYYRIQVWDEESKSVKVVAEGGDRKLYNRLVAKQRGKQ